MKWIFAVKQRRNRYRREEKSISRRRKIDIAAKKKSILPQRKNRYRRKEKLISPQRKKTDIAAKKKSISPRRKIDYRVEEKIDIAAKENRYRREEKIDYCVEEKIDIAAKEESAVAESSYQTLEHHLRGEQKWKLCLLEQLSRDRRCGQKISF